MNDMTDIFIHTEGQEKAAYQAGQEIARMMPMGQERFLAALYRWMRENGSRALWKIDERGNVVSAADIERELERVRQEQEGRSRG